MSISRIYEVSSGCAFRINVHARDDIMTIRDTRHCLAQFLCVVFLCVVVRPEELQRARSNDMPYAAALFSYANITHRSVSLVPEMCHIGSYFKLEAIPADRNPRPLSRPQYRARKMTSDTLPCHSLPLICRVQQVDIDFSSFLPALGPFFTHSHTHCRRRTRILGSIVELFSGRT